MEGSIALKGTAYIGPKQISRTCLISKIKSEVRKIPLGKNVALEEGSNKVTPKDYRSWISCAQKHFPVFLNMGMYNICIYDNTILLNNRTIYCLTANSIQHKKVLLDL